ncbi:MAG: hypothetical protein HYW47_06715, partial [Deltaproteobacteria bacterium]|nr:hypothetical protein [Deltaproteobacteria bacterium]
IFLKKINFIFLLGVILWGVFGCDAHREYEYYNNSNITLNAQNHPHGFRQTQCFYCHVKSNIHQVNRYGNALFDTAKDLVESDGLSSCSLCHGANGAP